MLWNIVGGAFNFSGRLARSSDPKASYWLKKSPGGECDTTGLGLGSGDATVRRFQPSIAQGSYDEKFVHHTITKKRVAHNSRDGSNNPAIFLFAILV